jgi:hypothetical protein
VHARAGTLMDEAEEQEEGVRGQSFSFLASLPVIQTAISAGGDGSMRVKLEIPASEKRNAIPLLALDGRVLEVTIRVAKSKESGEPTDDGPSTGSRAPKRSKAKRRVVESRPGV